jgi:hypothetical protein
MQNNNLAKTLKMGLNVGIMIGTLGLCFPLEFHIANGNVKIWKLMSTLVDLICFKEESSCLSSDSSSLLLRGPRSSPIRFLSRPQLKTVLGTLLSTVFKDKNEIEINHYRWDRCNAS